MTSLRKIEEMIAKRDIEGLKAWLTEESREGPLTRLLRVASAPSLTGSGSTPPKPEAGRVRRAHGRAKTFGLVLRKRRGRDEYVLVAVDDTDEGDRIVQSGTFEEIEATLDATLDEASRRWLEALSPGREERAEGR